VINKLDYIKNLGNFSQFFRCSIGLSAGVIPDNSWIGQYPNSYAIQIGHSSYACRLAGTAHQFIRPRWKHHSSNVYGCGLVLDPKDKLWIFFTLNGQLMSKLVWVLEVLSISQKK
jgi:hypothetical protein